MVLLISSSNLRKVSILLDAFEAAQKDVEYYALDLSLPELERTFSMLDIAAYKHVIFRGLHGTYDDALAWLSDVASSSGLCDTTCVLTLGSSIGNFTPGEAAEFLAGFARVLSPTDRILVGLDACQDAARVFRAYNDDKHVTERFYRNGLENANRLLGYSAFRQEDWNLHTAFDEISKKHFATYYPKMDVKTKDFSVRAGEIVYLEESWKFPGDRSDKLWRDAGLVHQSVFEHAAGDHRTCPSCADRIMADSIRTPPPIAGRSGLPKQTSGIRRVCSADVVGVDSTLGRVGRCYQVHGSQGRTPQQANQASQ